jgi:hypothetical protein
MEVAQSKEMDKVDAKQQVADALGQPKPPEHPR